MGPDTSTGMVKVLEADGQGMYNIGKTRGRGGSTPVLLEVWIMEWATVSS